MLRGNPLLLHKVQSALLLDKCLEQSNKILEFTFINVLSGWLATFLCCYHASKNWWYCLSLIVPWADKCIFWCRHCCKPIVTIVAGGGRNSIAIPVPPFVAIFWYVEALETYFCRPVPHALLPPSLLHGQINNQVSCLQECCQFMTLHSE